MGNTTSIPRPRSPGGAGSSDRGHPTLNHESPGASRARETDSISGTLPRKRNRFSTIRNHFRPRSSEHAQQVSNNVLDSSTSTGRLKKRHCAQPYTDTVQQALHSENALDSTPHISDSAQHQHVQGSQLSQGESADREWSEPFDNSELTDRFTSSTSPPVTQESLASEIPVTSTVSSTTSLGIPSLVTEVPTQPQPNSPLLSNPLESTESAAQDLNEAVPTEASPSIDRVEGEQTREPGEVVSPMPGEDQASMLARLLSIAAAATAASLVGHNNHHALRDARELAQGNSVAPTAGLPDSAQGPRTDESDLVDGSFDGFLAALQGGRLAQALRNGGNTLGGGQDAVSPQQPLNFFRMFRFTSAVNIQGSSSADNDQDVRMVPIIIVGIRSVPAREGAGSPLDAVPSFFGALQTHNSQNRTDNSQQESESQTVGTRPIDISSQNEADVLAPNSAASTSSELASSGEQASADVESRIPTEHVPVPPRRPTSTSRTSTIDSRGSERPMSGIMESVMDRLRSFRPDNTASGPSQSDLQRRRRRRSTWRPFSTTDLDAADASTRDGSPQSPNSSSFLVYVLGGSYPENHPILTTPSLFTDTPSYEDMLLLTSLIGPAKPETAEAQDLDSAGTVYTLDERSAELETRCQICLSDYECADTCRSLTKCGHSFHKECIDEWLTTGRNNCPMCRSKTGARTQAPDSATTQEASPGTIPEAPAVLSALPALGPVLEFPSE